MNWLIDLWRKLTGQARFRVGEYVECDGEIGVVTDFVPGGYLPLEGWQDGQYVIEWPQWAAWHNQTDADRNFNRANHEHY